MNKEEILKVFEDAGVKFSKSVHDNMEDYVYTVENAHLFIHVYIKTPIISIAHFSIFKADVHIAFSSDFFIISVFGEHVITNYTVPFDAVESVYVTLNKINE